MTEKEEIRQGIRDRQSDLAAEALEYLRELNGVIPVQDAKLNALTADFSALEDLERLVQLAPEAEYKPAQVDVPPARSRSRGRRTFSIRTGMGSA